MKDFLNPIFDEKDLETYEEFLKNELKNTNSETFENFLQTLLGKQIKVDCLLGNHLESRSGKLIKIGEDFLLLRLQNCSQLLINKSLIKFISLR